MRSLNLTRFFVSVVLFVFLVSTASAILGGTPSSEEMVSLFEENPDKAWEEFDREEHMNEKVLEAAMENSPSKTADFLNDSFSQDTSFSDFNITDSFGDLAKSQTSITNDYPKLRKKWFSEKYEINDNGNGLELFRKNGLVKTKGPGSTEFNLSKDVFKGANITDTGEVILEDGTVISSSKVTKDDGVLAFEGGFVNLSSSDRNASMRKGILIKGERAYQSSGFMKFKSNDKGFSISGNDVFLREIGFDKGAGTKILGKTTASFNGTMIFEDGETIIGKDTRYSPFDDGQRAMDFNVEKRSLYTSDKSDCDQAGFSCIFREGSNVSVDPVDDNNIIVDNLVDSVSESEQKINNIEISKSSNGNYFQVGDSGKEVKKIQRIVGMDEDNVDGVYDEDTARAVKEWQRQNNIAVDGLFGEEARETAFADYDFGTVFNDGQKGSKVENLQKFLISEGYDLPQYGVDGTFGSETKSALEEWQKDNDLSPTGVFGQDSLRRASVIAEGRSQYSFVSQSSDHFIDDFSVSNIDDESSVVFKEDSREAHFSKDFPEFKGNYKNFESNLVSGFTSSNGEKHKIKVVDGVLKHCSQPCTEFGLGKIMESQVEDFKKEHGKEFFDKMREKYGEQIRSNWLTRYLAPEGTGVKVSDSMVKASNRIKQVTGKDISPKFLYIGAVSEGLNDEILYRIRNPGSSSGEFSGPTHFGLDHFGGRADKLKREGYLPKDFKEGEDYESYVSKGLGRAEGQNKGKIVPADFPNLESGITAMAAEYAKRRDTFEGDIRELGMDPADFSKEEVQFWTYVYYNTGSGTGKKMLKSYKRKGWLESKKYLWRNENPDESWTYSEYGTKIGPQVLNNRRISNLKMLKEAGVNFLDFSG